MCNRLGKDELFSLFERVFDIVNGWIIHLLDPCCKKII